MIYYDRIDVSEETDVNKTTASKECDAKMRQPEHYKGKNYKSF